jgi:type IV pilus assembly protein PilM
MPVQHGVWGIDIGQSALKALRLEIIDGVLTATAFDYVEHPKILSQPDADPDQLTREALEKFLSRNNIKGDQVAISVPGQSGLARFVKLPPVEEKKIGDIVRFEAKQQIPFPLDEVVWDFQKIGSGEVTDGFAMETEIGLFAMKRDQINRSLAQFQDVKVEVHAIQMAPLSLCNFVAYDLLNKGGAPAPAPEEPAAEDDGPRGKKKCVVALDVGTDSSNLVITDGEKIIWQRPIPLGGNHLTRALSKEMKLTFAKAEHLKRNAAKSPPELKTILAALKPVLTDFVGEVQRSLGFFTNTHREAMILYMVGLGSAFRLPGLQKYLQEKLQLEVRKPNSFNRLVGDDVVNAPVFTENVLGFAVPYGLALQGVGLAKLHTNLLPQEIRFDRMIREKKPWVVAAAAALFLGTGLLTLGYAINYRAVSAAEIEKSITAANGKINDVNAAIKMATDKEGEVSKVTKEVTGVIAGKDEQLNWLILNKFINAQLPQPDGSNLKENPLQTRYWATEKAAEALREYQSRVRGGQNSDQPMPDDVRENLVLVDVEAISSLYTDNLKTAFENAKRAMTRYSGIESFVGAGMCPYDAENPPRETPPDGAGWVIEIRGSTYQKDNRQFILDTLVRNLTVHGRTLPLEAAPGAAAGAPATPPPSSPPAGQPAAALPPGEAAQRARKMYNDDTITDDKEAEKMDAVIKDRIRHVFLLTYATEKDPKPGAFKIIGQSYLRDVLSPPAAAATGPAAAAAGGTRSDRDTWVPLPHDGESGNSGGGPGGLRGGFGRDAIRPGGPRPGPVAPVNIGGGAQPAAKDGKPRYEFVIMFFWQEPTPSDALMNLTATPPAAAGGGGQNRN